MAIQSSPLLVRYSQAGRRLQKGRMCARLSLVHSDVDSYGRLPSSSFTTWGDRHQKVIHSSPVLTRYSQAGRRLQERYALGFLSDKVTLIARAREDNTVNPRKGKEQSRLVAVYLQAHDHGAAGPGSSGLLPIIRSASVLSAAISSNPLTRSACVIMSWCPSRCGPAALSTASVLDTHISNQQRNP